MSTDNIFVTQPFLPPMDEYTSLLEKVWKSGILTHNGPMVCDLERALSRKINASYFSLVTNGTVALQMAIKALNLKGEIITTPFSWIATVSSIKWEGCKPIFCDIEEDSFNIDPSKLEELITKDTVAIMPVHVFGVPCNIDEIKRIAHKHNLKVIYDGAHALGSRYKDQSVLNFGDISTTSLHGTKLFNTAEGGACITSNLEYSEKLQRIRFFGHDDTKNIVEDGMNGKMTEVHAALGLASMKYFDSILLDRKEKYALYLDILSSSNELKFQKCRFGESNFSYFPIVFSDEATLLRVERLLNESNIYPRRYFYPSLNKYTAIVDYQKVPISESLSKRILCLPLYFNLKNDDIKKISNIVLEAMSETCNSN